MTYVLNILICLTISATILVATNDKLINQLIQDSSDSYCDDKVSDLEKIVFDLTSRLQAVEEKLAQQDVHKENYELRSKIEDINDEFQKHVTSSEIRFGVIEQIVEDHVTASYNHFSEVEENLRNHTNASESHFRQVEDSHRDHVTSSDSHFVQVEQTLGDYIASSDNQFSQVNKSLGEITTTIQVILYVAC